MQVRASDARLFSYIQGYIREHGERPTYTEMSNAIGAKSRNTVQQALRRLEADGCLVCKIGPSHPKMEAGPSSVAVKAPSKPSEPLVMPRPANTPSRPEPQEEAVESRIIKVKSLPVEPERSLLNEHLRRYILELKYRSDRKPEAIKRELRMVADELEEMLQ